MDKKALLSDLKIDREASGAAPARRPVKWFASIAVVVGIGLVAWAYGLPPLQSSAMEVRTVAAKEVGSPSGDSVLDATGYVVARRRATVSSKATGKVMEVFVEEGMSVREGQILAVLDASIPNARLALAQSQLNAARAALDEIRVRIRQAELESERVDALAARELASRAESDRNQLALDALRARLARGERDVEVAERGLAVQRELLADFEIRAPFDGIVIAKAAQPGEMISPVSAGGGFTRTGICTIVDMESLEVEVDVNEEYITRVHPRQPASVRLNAYEELEIPAEVIATIPAADRGKATVRVRIGFLGRDPRILPDMGVRVAFLEAKNETADAMPAREVAGVLVPRSAVFAANGANHVWVVAANRAERRHVEVAGDQGANARVVAGLRAGERVVDSLARERLSNLADGVEVRIVN